MPRTWIGGGVKRLLTPLALMVPLTILRGFVVAVLWRWFLAEPFGWPELGIAHAAGLGGLVGYVTAQIPPKDTPGQLFMVLYAVTIAALSLASGWVLKGFMP